LYSLLHKHRIGIRPLLPQHWNRLGQVLTGGGFTTEGLADEGGGGARREREKPYGSPVEGHKLDANGLDGGGEQRRDRAALQWRGRTHRDGMKGRASTTRCLPPRPSSPPHAPAYRRRELLPSPALLPPPCHALHLEGRPWSSKDLGGDGGGSGRWWRELRLLGVGGG
jgi:hypothetical protein